MKRLRAPLGMTAWHPACRRSSFLEPPEETCAFRLLCVRFFANIRTRADVAQLVEHRTRNAGVKSSSLFVGTIKCKGRQSGGLFGFLAANEASRILPHSLRCFADGRARQGLAPTGNWHPPPLPTLGGGRARARPYGRQQSRHPRPPRARVVSACLISQSQLQLLPDHFGCRRKPSSCPSRLRLPCPSR